MPAMTDVTVDYAAQQDERQTLRDQALYPDQLMLPPSTSMSSPVFSDSDSTIAQLADSSTSIGNAAPVHGQFSCPVSSTITDLDQSLYIAPYKDVKDDSAVQGVCGLRNLGNTCFVNSGLQCLLSNPRLAQFFLSRYDLNDEVKETLTGHFARVMSKAWCGQYSMLYPSEFKQVMGMYHTQFSDYRQHDCQEFLALLLDNLHEQLNSMSAEHEGSSVFASTLPSNNPQCSTLSLSGAASCVTSCPIDTSCDQEVSHSIPLAEQICGSGSELSQSPPSVREFSESPQVASEDSNLSIASRSSDNVTTRSQTIPAGVKPFQVDKMEDTHPMDTTEATSIISDWKIQDEKIVVIEDIQRNDGGDYITVKDPIRGVKRDKNNTERGHEEVQTIKYDLEQDPDLPFPTDQKQMDTDKLIIVDKDSLLNKEEKMDTAACGKEQAEQADLDIDQSDKVKENSRSFPSIEDLYMKDTKILNTNVLATEFIHEVVATDSQKYHKPDNTSHQPTPEEGFDQLEQLNNDLSYETVTMKFATSKPLKETNLLANYKDKFADSCYPKKALFSDIASEEKESNINNIKRIKIEEDDKNIRMQAKLKVNTDKNPVKEDTVTVTSVMKGSLSPIHNPMTEPAIPEPASPQQVESELVDQLSQEARWEKDLQDADSAWGKYLHRNKSVIVDTFQGQFKSTVVCLACQHFSVTFEPFMYLSVPLPNAMERQICVTFMPCDNKQPVRYLIILNKQDKVSCLKQKLLNMIDEEECDIIMAEVLDCHISRILDDHTMLRYVNDTNRSVYAFEMLPAPQIEDETSQTDISLGNTDIASVSNIPPNNAVPSTSAGSQDIFSNIGTFPVDYFQAGTNNEMWQNDDPIYSASTAPNTELQGHFLNNLSEASALTLGHDRDLAGSSSWQENLLDAVQSKSVVATATQASLIEDKPSVDRHIESWQEEAENCEGRTANDDIIPSTQWSTKTGTAENKTSDEDSSGVVAVVDQWRSCAICLEEMADCELMVHPPCDGTLCQSCLEMSFKHYGNTAFACPVCSSPVNPADDFVQLNCMANYKPKTRILPVVVVYRLDGESDGKYSRQLFGHPNVLYLPSQMTGEFLYESVDRVVPCLANYSILLTDGQGYSCSRCLFTQHCKGCDISRNAAEVKLQPGDNLAIQFSHLTQNQMDNASSRHDHSSMDLLRSDDPLTLFDCFKAFTRSEFLDEHNPWFCPCCEKNQCARKTMTVWRYPETLVVYLKRFVFHELMSTKIDNKVVFPLENLDLSCYLSGPEADNMLYDLQACICHFGGASAGHYTAYAKHPLSNEWHYFNDETVTCQPPTEADFNNAYVLFYQKHGTKITFTPPSQPAIVEEDSIFTQPVSIANDPVMYGPHLPEDLWAGEGEMVDSEPKTKCYDFYQ